MEENLELFPEVLQLQDFVIVLNKNLRPTCKNIIIYNKIVAIIIRVLFLKHLYAFVCYYFLNIYTLRVLFHSSK